MPRHGRGGSLAVVLTTVVTGVVVCGSVTAGLFSSPEPAAKTSTTELPGGTVLDNSLGTPVTPVDPGAPTSDPTSPATTAPSSATPAPSTSVAVTPGGSAWSPPTSSTPAGSSTDDPSSTGNPASIGVPTGAQAGAEGSVARIPAPVSVAAVPGASVPIPSDPGTEPAPGGGLGSLPTPAPRSSAPHSSTPAPGSSAPSSGAPGSGAPSSGAPSTGAPGTSAPGSGSSAPSAPRTGAPRSGSWLSGASGTGVGNGEFAAWRGSAVDIAGTWADNNTAMTQLWQLQPGSEYGSWNQSLDIAIGAIGDGESWSQAAGGAYDGRWRESLTKLRQLWGNRAGTVYIRFAHEMNGNWYPWSVRADNKDAFVASWKRFRALQQEIFPQSQLVFCVNRESVDSGVDWRKTFPGAQYVDALGVDYYNQNPYVSSEGDWQSSVDDTDGYGAPKGLGAHLDFARSVGLPLVVPEWSGNADKGDSPAFIAAMHSFFAAHAGSGAGQLMYEIQFNCDRDGQRWQLYGGTRMPSSAASYRSLF